MDKDGNQDGVRLADFNADGKVDIGFYNNGTGQHGLWFGTDSGWQKSALDILVTFSAKDDHADEGSCIVDLNGDGHPDIVRFRRDDPAAWGHRTWINHQGKSWGINNNFALPASIVTRVDFIKNLAVIVMKAWLPQVQEKNCIIYGHQLTIPRNFMHCFVSV